VAVAPVSNKREQEVVTGIWKSRGFIFIPMKASDFISGLNKVIYVVKEKDAFNKLPDEMGIDPGVIQEIATTLENTFTNFNQGDGVRYLTRSHLGKILWHRKTALDKG